MSLNHPHERGWRLSAAGSLLLAALLVWNPGCSSDVSGKEDKQASASKDAEGKATTTHVSNEADSSGDEKDKTKTEKPKETPVPVEVATLEAGSIESFLRSSANLEAENHVKVFSQAARLVRDLRVEEGDVVRQGDLLVRLQDEEQRSALAKVQNQYDKSFREYDLQETLYEKELISKEVFTNATYEVEQLRISLEDAQRDLGYTEVLAPISGTITDRLVQVGDQVSVAQHLFDLVDFDSMVARIYVPEKNLPRIAVGQSAWITTQGDEETPRPGTVIRISPIVDSQSGTVKVTVAPNGRQGLRPGMYVNVKVITDVHHDVVLVPKRALIYDQDQVFVYRLGEKRRVQRVLVERILEDAQFMEPGGDLGLGDQIVVAGQAGLKDDALVRLPGDPEEKDDDSEGESAPALLADEEKS